MAEKKKVTFDEKNLKENAKILKEANYKKIDEAKTPYYADQTCSSDESPSDAKMREYEEIDSEIKDEKNDEQS